MEKLIKKVFNEILDQEVRIINLPEDDIDMAIYVVRDKRIKKISNSELAKYGFDYAITRFSPKSRQWLYIISEFTDGVVSKGEPVEPPDTIFNESVMTYDNSEKALQELILHLVKNNIGEIIMEHEYKPYE